MALMPWVWTCTSSKWATGFDTQTNPIKAEFSNLVSEGRFRRQGSVLAEDSFSATNVDRLQDFFQEERCLSLMKEGPERPIDQLGVVLMIGQKLRHPSRSIFRVVSHPDRAVRKFFSLVRQ